MSNENDELKAAPETPAGRPPLAASPAAIVQWISLGLGAVESLVQLITELRSNAITTGQWTPAQDAAFTAQLNTMFASSAWQTDTQKLANNPPTLPVEPAKT